MAPRSKEGVAGARWAVTALVVVVSACTAGTSEVTGASTPPASATTVATSITAPGSPVPSIEFHRIDDSSFDGGTLSGVVEAGPGLVAVGSNELPEDAAVWVSSDGQVWDRIESASFSGVPDANGLDGAQRMVDVAVGPAGIVAVGSYERKTERDIDVGVWFSTDGLEWERIVGDVFSGPGTDSAFSIDVWNGFYIAGGHGPGPDGPDGRRPAIWISENGREWERIASPAFDVNATISALAHSGSHLVAVGSGGHVGRPAVWLSEDARTWEGVFSEDAGGSDFGSISIGDIEASENLVMTAVATTPDGFVAAGMTGEPSSAAFWESADGLFWDLTMIASDYERATVPVSVASLTATPSGLFAVGTGRLSTTRFPPLSYAEVWLSTDGGLTWEQIPRGSTSTVTEGPTAPWHMGAMTDVITFDSGLVASGFVPFQNVTLPGPFYRQAIWLGFWE